MIKKLYKDTVTINFEETRHIFSHENGKRISGVTSITGMIDKSQILIWWAIGLTKGYLLRVLSVGKIGTEDIEEACKQHTIKKAEAGDIGTQIHGWIENWINNKKQELPTDEKVVNGINAFLKWIKETGIELSQSEEIVYSKKYDYAGIMDAEGKQDGKSYIIDFKSSKGIYNEYRYQLSAYWNAREEETGKKYDGGWIVKFGKDDGEFAVLFIDPKEYKKDFKAFLGALAIKKREKELC